MIMTDQQVERIYRYLSHDWKAYMNIVGALVHGNKKHADDETDAEKHIDRALSHLAKDGNDEETGEPHWAHAVARLILAIETIMQQGSKGAE